MNATGHQPLTVAAAKIRTRRDYRPKAFAAVFAGIIMLGTVVSLLSGQQPSLPAPTAAKITAASSPFAGIKESSTEGRGKLAEVEPPTPKIDPKDPQSDDVKRTLEKAGAQVKAKRYDDAIRTLHQARPLLHKHANAYLLLASALEGKQDFATARDFYEAAIDRNPYLSEAYWGYATTSESLGDLESALGAMRNYLHTEPNPDPQRLKVVQARSAIWEWESQLERGPWGPTKGIPPGFTREELKRDGRGVGIKMPIPATEKADGSTKYEIKHQDKFKLFKPD